MLAPPSSPVYVTGKGLDDVARKLSVFFPDYAKTSSRDIELYVISLVVDKSYKAIC